MNPNPNPDSAVVDYEMGYAADEFGRVLLGPFSGERSDFASAELGRHRWRVTLDDQDFVALVEVREAPPRKIGLFSLPVLKVRFEFEVAEDGTRERFFRRFHQYFQKGGG